MFGSVFKSIGKKVVKGLSRSIPRIIKGIKQGIPTITKGIKSGFTGVKSGLQAVIKKGQNIIKRSKNLFKSKPKPKGVVKEKVIQKGGRVIRPTEFKPYPPRPAGTFDETLLKVKPIKDIPKQGIVKQGLGKRQRLELAKAALKSGKPVKNLF
tara:strand:+ start:478 stop:936 length:459 start_codon:yes stop_codon:yes gene_type:complete